MQTVPPQSGLVGIVRAAGRLKRQNGKDNNIMNKMQNVVIEADLDDSFKASGPALSSAPTSVPGCHASFPTFGVALKLSNRSTSRQGSD